MKFKDWFIKHYSDDLNKTNAEIILKLFIFSFVSAVSVFILFLSLVNIEHSNLNEENCFDFEQVDFPEYEIKTSHYFLVGIIFLSFLYWVDFLVYLFRKYLEYVKK